MISACRNEYWPRSGERASSLELEELPPDQLAQPRLDLLPAQAGDGRQAFHGEAHADDRGVLHQRAILGWQHVQPCRDQRVERLGDVEGPDLAHEDVGVVAGFERAAVDQHPDGLHGVERHPLGARDDPLDVLRRHAPDESLDELGDHRVGERLEVHRGEAALAGSPVRAFVGELGSRHRDDQDRMALRPLEHRLDEVEQPRVGPLEVLEDHHDGALLRDPLEERAPRGEQLLAVAVGSGVEPEQVREPRLDPSSLVGIGDELGHRRRELAP